MRLSFVWLCGAILLMVFALGCSSSAVWQGRRAIRQKDYSAAEAHFQQALGEDPANFDARRGLGITAYYQGDYPAAASRLEAALRSRPDDGRTVLYLGMTREAQQEYTAAQAIYERYLVSNKNSQIARKIKGRSLFVGNENLRRQARQAIKFESSLVTDTSAGLVVGVLPFIPLGDGAARLRPLGNGLAALVGSDLSQIAGLKVVERAQLKYILDELALAETGRIDDKSAPRIGRLIGAQQLVNGNVAATDPEHIAVQSGIVHTTSTLYSPAINSEDRSTNIARLQKKVTFAIIDSLGIELTPAERTAIETTHTVDSAAFWAFCRGLDEYDRGNFSAANDLFNEAASLDPGFEQAEELEEETKSLLEGGGSAEDFLSSVDNILDQGFGATVEPTEDIFELTAPEIDPRTDDDSSRETGSASIHGTIR